MEGPAAYIEAERETRGGAGALEQSNFLERLRGGDRAAMEGLLEEYGPMMAYVVGGILPDRQEAEDCLAQVQAKLWEKAAAYDGEKAGPATWLTAVCRNAAYDRLRALERQARRTGELPEDAPDPSPGPEEALLRRERAMALKKALAALSRADYNLFYRKYYYLQSTQRIAAELGTTPRAVEGRLYRIRKKLQRQLGGDAL